MTETDKKWQKVLEVAQNRFFIIAPALAPDINPTERRQIIQEIVVKNGISERTVYRLLEKYNKGQLEALKPRVKTENEIACTAITPDVLEYALKLKIELPKRSIPQILATMKSQGIVKDKEVAQSTLRRYIRRMKHLWHVPPTPRGTGSRSFQMSKCNIMWQSDIKEVREIRVFDENNPDKKTFVYWVAFLDDKSRLLCHGEWYTCQQTPEVLDCLRKAVEKYGIPFNIYTDNGSQFISGRFGSVCAGLGIRHQRAEARKPESKGKIERLNRTVEEFIQEMVLEKPKNLVELNKHFRVWMDDYNNRVHSSLEGFSPQAVFNMDKTPRRKLDFNTLRDKFKAIEWRKVLKNGCIKLNGTQYDVGNEHIGKELQFRYEELDTQAIELWVEDKFIKTIYPLEIGEKNKNYYKKRNENLIQQANTTEGGKLSLVAQGWEKNHGKRLEKRYGGLSFADMPNTIEEGDNNAI